MPPDLKSQIYARLVNIVPDWTQFDYFSTTTASQFHIWRITLQKMKSSNLYEFLYHIYFEIGFQLLNYFGKTQSNSISHAL